MDTAPEADCVPGPFFAIAPDVVFEQKGARDDAISTAASTCIAQTRRALEERATAAFLRRRGRSGGGRCTMHQKLQHRRPRKAAVRRRPKSRSRGTMAALVRNAERPQLQHHASSCGGSPDGMGGLLCCDDAVAAVSIAAAAVKLRRRRRKIAHKGFEGRLATALSGAATIASACPQAAWGWGRRGAMVVSVSRGLRPSATEAAM